MTLAQGQLTMLQSLPPMPDHPHLLTDFQISRDLVKLNPLNGSGLPPILVDGCGGLAADAKLDILKLMTKLIGQQGLAALTGIFVP